MYIVRRTQLYIEEDLWNALHDQARYQRTTISNLVRRAVRDRYLGSLEERRNAMQAFVGVWKNRSELANSEDFVRVLRRGNRIEKAEKG